jgi:thioredoxin 1
MNKLLVFSASWCAPCKAMKPMLDELDQDRLVRYDIDEATNERAQYDVRAVPTLILVNETGEELERLIGSQSLSAIQKLLDV